MPSIKLNNGTTNFTLKVVDYQKYDENKYNVLYCDIILEISNYYMNYKRKLNDIMLNIELEQLIDLLEKLLLNNISENKKLYFEAPDLSFEAYKIDNSIWLDIIINFPTNEKVYDAEKWTVSFDCEEIIVLYLGLLSEISECNNSLASEVKSKMIKLLEAKKDYFKDEKIINEIINDNIALLDAHINFIPKEGEYLCIVATYGNYGKEYTFLCRGVRHNVIWKVEGDHNIINFKKYVILKEKDLPVPLDKMKYAIPTEVVSY